MPLSLKPWKGKWSGPRAGAALTCIKGSTGNRTELCHYVFFSTLHSISCLPAATTGWSLCHMVWCPESCAVIYIMCVICSKVHTKLLQGAETGPPMQTKGGLNKSQSGLQLPAAFQDRRAHNRTETIITLCCKSVPSQAPCALSVENKN